MSLIEEISNKIYKRHTILEHAEKSLFEIKDELIDKLKEKHLDKYEIKAKVKHEIYEIELVCTNVNYKKIEFTYHEIARKLVDQIEISKDDIRNAMEKIIFEKMKL